MSRLGKLNKMTKKKKVIMTGFLALVLCAGVFAGSLNKAPAQDSDSDIPVHDGDVLVDSLNLSAMPGSGSVPASGTATGTALVTSDDISELSNADTYFEEMRATVTMDRNQVISMLTDVIAEAENTGEKDNATSQKLKIIDYMNKEKIIESLIETKGLPECLVLITDNGVNVTVNKQDLAKSEVAKICDIVIRETGRAAAEIVIQSKF